MRRTNQAQKRKSERERDRKKKRDREKRSGESEVPRSDQSSQAFRVTRSGTILPTLLLHVATTCSNYMLTTCCYQAELNTDWTEMVYIVRFTGQAITIWLFLMQA